MRKTLTVIGLVIGSVGIAIAIWAINKCIVKSKNDNWGEFPYYVNSVEELYF